ncbi:MAG: recombination protein RecR [Peptococcaceae bacterium]|nr:recombination protein RecR [Peptococcaceae bacterium]
MNYHYPPSMTNLINYLMKLPGVGPKSAQRLAFFLLAAPEQDACGLGGAIVEARQKIRHCKICGNLSDEDTCMVCKDQTRDETILCVVEQPKDVVMLENTREFHGRYHVLHGAISPMEGIGPEQLTIDMLMKRLKEGGIQEVVMATNPSVEGDATVLYLSRLIKPLGIKVTRIAHGIPVGGDLEYADEATLSRAFWGRREL